MTQARRMELGACHSDGASGEHVILREPPATEESLSFRPAPPAGQSGHKARGYVPSPPHVILMEPKRPKNPFPPARAQRAVYLRASVTDDPTPASMTPSRTVPSPDSSPNMPCTR